MSPGTASGSTRLVFWQHPVLGLMADLPDGTRLAGLKPGKVAGVAAAWARDRLAGAKREASG